MKRFRVRIYGKVQGVFFRANCKRIADRLGIKGWVRNREDGSVEAVFEGREADLKLMLEWCKRGPPLAKVEKIKIKEEKYKGEFKNFSILF